MVDSHMMRLLSKILLCQTLSAVTAAATHVPAVPCLLFAVLAPLAVLRITHRPQRVVITHAKQLPESPPVHAVAGTIRRAGLRSSVNSTVTRCTLCNRLSALCGCYSSIYAGVVPRAPSPQRPPPAHRPPSPGRPVHSLKGPPARQPLIASPKNFCRGMKTWILCAHVQVTHRTYWCI